MIDLRYHVYSLAAVIVALAIGFVFGTSSVSKRADVAQVQRISDRYEHDLTAMQTEVRNQRDSLRSSRGELSRSEKLCSVLMPEVLKGKLSYRNIAIIQTGDYDDLTAQVRSAIMAAGGYVTNVTKIPVSFRFEDAPTVSDVVSSTGIVLKPDESERVALIRTIAEAVSAGKHSEKLSMLEDKHVISVSGEYDRWSKLVVVVGGSASEDSDRASLVDIPLIERLEGMSTAVVACEPSGAGASYVPAWKRTDIATVDNVDTSCGQVALVCALAGETAHFGQKRTAERLLPQSLGGAQ